MIVDPDAVEGWLSLRGWVRVELGQCEAIRCSKVTRAKRTRRKRTRAARKSAPEKRCPNNALWEKQRAPQGRWGFATRPLLYCTHHAQKYEKSQSPNQ